jgi:DNA-directed RNA polymerase specialized sigma24 family protein
MELEMAASNPITEEELEEVFRDDPEFGLGLLCTDFRDQIARYIKSRLWGLPSGIRAEEIKDVFQETMLALVPFVRNQDFDWQQPLRIVYDVANKKAIDALRRRKFRPKQDVDGAIDQIARDLAGTNIGLEWRLQTQAEWKEFCAALRDAVGTVLTDKQAIVVRCYVDNYEDFGEREIYAPLARLVSEITGEDENAVTIKKHWHEAKKRLVRELARKGFNFLETEE